MKNHRQFSNYYNCLIKKLLFGDFTNPYFISCYSIDMSLFR